MSKNTPTLSVIVPVHNAERYLTKCLDSLLAQTYTDFELILVVNGSTDSSAEICHSCASQTPTSQNIRVLEQPRPSVSAARNAGIEAARGRYVTFMDADDWVETEYLAEFFRLPLPEGNVLVMQGILLDFTEQNSPHEQNRPFFSYPDLLLDRSATDAGKAVVRTQLLHNGCPVSKLFDRELLNRIGLRFPEEISSHEDHVFTFRYLRHTDIVAFRTGIYYHYMLRGEVTLSQKSHPAEELLLASSMLETEIPTLLSRFGVTDREYIDFLYRDFTLYQLMKATSGLTWTNYKRVFKALTTHRELLQQTKCRLVPHSLLTKNGFRLLYTLPEQLHFLVFGMVCLRKLELRMRGIRK